MLAYNQLTPTEKAVAAEVVLQNSVFHHIITDLLDSCNGVAINGTSHEEREAHRQAVIWYTHLVTSLQKHVNMRVEHGGSGS